MATNAIDYTIDEDHTVKIFSAPYFIATKLEAFKSPDRENNNDGRMSTDFEDIIFVLENRSTIWDELDNTTPDLKAYLQNEFKNFLENPSLDEWVDAHAGYGSPPATYFIISMIENFAR